MTRAQEPAELRPGLPPVELRRVHRIWIDDCGDELHISEDGNRGDWRRISGCRFDNEQWFDLEYYGDDADISFYPLHKSWSEVEALAAKATEAR